MEYRKAKKLQPGTKIYIKSNNSAYKGYLEIVKTEVYPKLVLITCKSTDTNEEVVVGHKPVYTAPKFEVLSPLAFKAIV